jgi:hypothetical protein
MNLGTGYELWANTTNNAIKKLDDILSVMEEIKTPESIKKYFDLNRDAKSLSLATSNGPFGAMTLVQSDDYPVAAYVIKDLFQLSPHAIAPTLASYAPGNVMLHLLAKADKESEAKKGIVKLMLLHICAGIDIEATLVSNIIPATLSKGMQVVLNQPCAAQASQFADLMQMTLELARQHDFTSIQLTQISIQVMLKILASHLLQGNFTTKKVTSLKIKANSVEPCVFLPQRNKVLVKRELSSKVKATSENVMDITNSHKIKGKTAIACIDTMHSMVDFSSLCINIDTIITAICSNDEPQGILHQILLNFVAIVNNPDWVHWSDNVGSMPLLHWYCTSFFKQIFNWFAHFARDFGKGNIMSKAHPITKLNTSTLKSALTVLKMFFYQINLHQATMTAIMVVPDSINAYTVNPWNNAQASGPRKDERHSPTDGTSCPTSNTTFMPKQRNGGKGDPAIPDTNKDRPSGHQRQKKPCRRVKVDTAAKEKKELGMFYLCNPSINPADIFPKDMPEKICANFTCKGKECTNTNCNFAHPRKALELKRKMIILIANHLIKKDVGWFNKYHFMRMPKITDGVKSFLVTQRVLPERWLDLSDSYIAM